VPEPGSPPLSPSATSPLHAWAVDIPAVPRRFSAPVQAQRHRTRHREPAAGRSTLRAGAPV
jgi:hypothetical protein